MDTRATVTPAATKRLNHYPFSLPDAVGLASAQFAPPRVAYSTPSRQANCHAPSHTRVAAALPWIPTAMRMITPSGIRIS